MEALQWIPGAREAVGLANAGNWWVFVVTNQSGIARGLYDLEAMHRFHAAMAEDLASAGARVDAWYACPFHPDAVRPEWRHPDHPDRKPNPGMLLRAMAEHPVDRASSVLIGDRASDLEAARRAGVRGVAYEGGDLSRLVEAVLAGADQSSASRP